jgi:hypothetical protein
MESRSRRTTPAGKGRGDAVPLEFTYHVEPDENGVFDGRELARQLIGNAYRLLVPYVKACPACADALFSVIANRTIEELHQEAREKGSMGGFSMSARTGDERQPGVDAHLEAATPATIDLLREAGAMHEQHDQSIH